MDDKRDFYSGKSFDRFSSFHHLKAYCLKLGRQCTYLTETKSNSLRCFWLQKTVLLLFEHPVVPLACYGH